MLFKIASSNPNMNDKAKLGTQNINIAFITAHTFNRI